MYIPVLSKRKGGSGGGGGGKGGGGGGGGKGGSSSSGSSGKSSGSSGKSSGSGTQSKPPAYTPGKPPPPYQQRGSTTASNSGNPFSIASGQPFAGRSAGGGTRGQIYSGNFGRGGLLGAAAFTFFGPWPSAVDTTTTTAQPPDNSSRPGGALESYTLLQTGVTNATGNTFAVYGDHNSIEDLLPIFQKDCGVAEQFGANFTADPTTAVANYRANSFALLLQGYNNTLPDVERESTDNSTLPNEILNAQPAPLPSTVNTTYFDCLNSTIVNNLGLIQTSGGSALAPSGAPVFVVGFVLWLAFGR